jgi:hypothetical protein
MDKPRPDPTQDIYEILDRADLTPTGVYNSKMSMSKIINAMRTKIATDTAEYIRQRELNNKEKSNG